jgi:hypothetical protein
MGSLRSTLLLREAVIVANSAWQLGMMKRVVLRGEKAGAV